MGLREEKKRETRAAILKTAVQLFRDNGFEGTRIQDIARRLRISEATFFNYFATKHSVLEAVAADLVDRSMELLHRDVVDDHRPVPERLEELATAFAHNFDGDREFVALLAGHTRFFLGARTEQFERGHLLLTELFADGQRRAEIRDDLAPEQLAELFISATLATVQGWVHAEPDDPPLSERLHRAASVMLNGCSPRAAATPRTRV